MATRRPMIAANWKMYKTIGEAAAFLDAFLPMVTGGSAPEGVDAVIAPPFTALSTVAQKLKGSGVMPAAQNVHQEKEGAYTGEVSCAMLLDAGAELVIIGHSERRQYFGEIDESVNKKTLAALGAGLKVILCIGESLKHREEGKTNDVLAAQLSGGLKGVPIDNVVIAYEPIWAIGTGVTATPQQAEDAHVFIRNHLASMYDKTKADGVRILYGGSVKPDNVDELMACANIDGALVGGASLKPDSFARLVKFKRSN